MTDGIEAAMRGPIGSWRRRCGFLLILFVTLSLPRAFGANLPSRPISRVDKPFALTTSQTLTVLGVKDEAHSNCRTPSRRQRGADPL